jgi:uncharacterized protein (DUF169 family)
VGAISQGKTKAVLDPAQLDRALKEKLGLTRHIAGLKFVDTVTDGVAVEPGPQFWCSLCGDVFEGQGKPLLFTAPASMCGGCANIGIGARRVPREEFDMAIDGQVVGEGNLYAHREVMSKNRDMFPQFPHIYTGVIVGSLEQMDSADLVLFPTNGHQLCIISTAFAFDSGELITGIAGKSTCLMTITTPLMRNRPIFAAGDHGGRMFMRLKDEELLICFPFRLIPGLVRNIDKTVYAEKH